MKANKYNTYAINRTTDMSSVFYDIRHISITHPVVPQSIPPLISWHFVIFHLSNAPAAQHRLLGVMP